MRIDGEQKEYKDSGVLVRYCAEFSIKTPPVKPQNSELTSKVSIHGARVQGRLIHGRENKVSKLACGEIQTSRKMKSPNVPFSGHPQAPPADAVS